MKVATFIPVSALLITPILAQSACSGQQYNTIPGYPASNSGCYPTNYVSTSDLGVTSPSDAQTRCSTQCTNMGSACGSYVAQVNKAADSNSYSGTCFFYSPSSPVGPPRQCANAAYLLLGYSKDFTNACFSSSTAAATAYCSSYLSIPVITSTATSTPPVVTSTITVTTSPTVTTTSTVSATATTTTVTTTTITSTSTTVVPAQKRKRTERRAQNVKRAAPVPACVSSNTPATRLSAACSCLSVKTSTTTTTKTLVPVTSLTTTTSTVIVTSTVTTTVTSATNTVTSTATTSTTVTVASQCPAATPNVCNGNKCVNLSSDRQNCGSCGNACAVGYQCSGGSCSQPAPCNAPTSGNNIYYCNSGQSCVCYRTTEGRGFCEDYTGSNSSCGSSCNTSSDCPNGQVCLDPSTTGCGSSSCSNAQCISPSKMLLRSRHAVKEVKELKERDRHTMALPPASS